MKGGGSDGGGREWWGEGVEESEGGGREGRGGVMEGGGRGRGGEEGWKGEGGERRDGRGRVGKEGKQWKEREGERWREEEWCGVMEGGDSEAHSSGLVVAHFRSFHFHPCAVVFICGDRVCPRSQGSCLSSFAGGCLRSWAGFMSWAFVIRAVIRSVGIHS